jgi:hypothetical protein
MIVMIDVTCASVASEDILINCASDLDFTAIYMLMMIMYDTYIDDDNV